MEANDRIRQILQRITPFDEKKMFGGIAFMVSGNMTCGITKDDLMLRLGNEGAAAALGEAHVRPMDFTGRPLKSMVFVAPDGFAADEDLERWLRRAVAFAQSPEGAKKK